MQKKKQQHKKPQKTKLVTEICFHAQSLTCLSNDSLSGFNSEYCSIVILLFPFNILFDLRFEFCVINCVTFWRSLF